MEGGAAGAISERAAAPSKRANPRTRRTPKKLHGYFIAFAGIFALLVIAGFWRSFFIPVAQGTFSRPPIVHVHGALFFAWTAILVAQTVLAGTGRLRLHRRVGAVARWLVLPMLMLGAFVAGRDAVNDFAAGEGDSRLSFFYGELADLAMFGLLSGGAMLLRHKPEFHKRWVILGSLGLLGAAVGRIPAVGDWGFQIFVGLIASMALYDLASRRRLHAATMIGAAVLLTLNLTQGAIGDSEAWLAFAHQLLPI
ncbi:MAG TPA: hypothetical protein VEZ41_13685 [Allosphingosinicella sp.]|nr:hypothetical protein [Allosphingosinicella sp.]